MKLVREDLKDVEAPADLIETKNIFLGLLVNPNPPKDVLGDSH